MFLAIFSIGVDGLAFQIYVQGRPVALFSITVLLAWQVAFIAYLFRHIFPVYRRIPEECRDRTTHLFLFRAATVLPAIWAIAASAVISTLSSGRH
jgi:hypothetical protein